MLSTKTIKLGSAVTIAANERVELQFAAAETCVGVAGWNLNNRDLAGKIEISGMVPNVNGVKIFGQNNSSSAQTITADSYIIAFVMK